LRNQRNGPKEIPKVKESVWEGRVRKNTYEKGLGSCYRSQGDVQTIKEKDLPSI